MLAYIIERIARDGVSPTLEEIAFALKISKGRAHQLIGQLVADGRLERRPGAQRRLVVRDVAASREVLSEVLNRLGWNVNDHPPPAPTPYPHVQLPRLPTLRYLPDPDSPGEPLALPAVTASSTAAGHDPVYVGNDYLGVTWQSASGADRQWLLVDLGADRAIDFAALLGCDGAGAPWTLNVEVATAAQGDGFPAGSFATGDLPFLAGAAMWESGRGIGWWSGDRLVGRYIRLTIGGLAGAAATVGRLVLGARIQLDRNFSFGGKFGVKDLGSYDLSARGVPLKRRGVRLPTLSIEFTAVHKWEVEAAIRPLIERLGNTGELFICTDPSPDAQRQRRCYYGTLVGDLAAVQRKASGWGWQANQVSLIR
ncbi:hypothetical protein SAMN05192583_1033 [Sphingomonas gellani]|uniref:LexA DNA binding domain-containing protein n=1 Tax=Sphingomonas gellani TaxID=1166340 RepID=A0A1H8ARN4_9SPHN|nr:hypothetical protein SAMN05192583_1033 [Sphingomonas gellani]